MTKFPMIKTFRIFYLVVIASLPGSSCLAGSIVGTKHNLSASGTGDVRALIEDRICVFCHTPHNATPLTPLWNKKIEPKGYELYTSNTLSAVPGQPSGPTRLCLSCHDGTIALGEVVNPPKPLLPGEAILMWGSDKLSPGMRSYLGEDISNDHPVVFSYYDALPNPELADPFPPMLQSYGGGNVHCTTCHDPHDNSFGKFLVMSNTGSKLCLTCHNNKTGWAGSAHATETKVWDPPAIEEVPQTVAEYGCESCHIPHGAGGPKRILRFLEEEQNCYSCHNATGPAKNIEEQFTKITKTSRHKVEATTIDDTADYHDPTESVISLQGHVECVDCHNPHAAKNMEAEPPAASGSLAGVSGIRISGIEITPLENQYELCFKCHGFSSNSLSVIERWIDQNNTMLEFNTINASYHPVTAVGKNSDVPSLPEGIIPDVNSFISCVDCHDSDESSAIGGIGPRGPHGSIYKPILRQRYGDGVSYSAESLTESESVYALCYSCHDRDILFSALGTSFRSVVDEVDLNLHTEHVREQHVPCYMCHDPHGVESTAGNGDHTHLINFAITVSAVAPNPAPFFTDDGSRAGSCTLLCHGHPHDGVTSGKYP